MVLFHSGRKSTVTEKAAIAKDEVDGKDVYEGKTWSIVGFFELNESIEFFRPKTNPFLSVDLTPH